jgi:hypothetical protein
MFSMHYKYLTLFILAFFFYRQYSFSQITSTSPYSSYGIGERDGIENAVFSGIGNSTITYFDSTTLNYLNPASYNTIGQGQPLFSVGISSRLSNYKEAGLSNFSKTVVINHFAMGFSFAKHFGFAFGLKPFSRRGYEFYTKELLVTDTIVHSYLGSGNTNEAFLGFSSNLIKLAKHQLAIGANAGYVFGSMTNERRSNLSTETAGGVDQKIVKINAFHYEFGLFYKASLNKSNNLTFSAVLEPSQSLTSSQETNLFASKFVDNSLYYQKVDSTGTIKGKIVNPMTTTVGFNYAFSFKDLKKGVSTRNSEISIHSTYSSSEWTKYRTTFTSELLNPNYINTAKFTFGIQYIPEKSFLGQTGSTKILETIRYRVGGYQYSLPLVVNGGTIIDRGATLGFGIPLRMQKSLSSVNFSLTYGKRGNSEATQLKEQYYGINLGVVFAPANFERWFIKRKFD